MTEQVLDSNPGRFGCNECSSRWGGYGHAHCKTCHRTFSGIATFDAHRSSSKTRPQGECYDPAEQDSGSQAQDPNGVWGTGDRSLRTPPRRVVLTSSDEINMLLGSTGHPSSGDAA